MSSFTSAGGSGGGPAFGFCSAFTARTIMNTQKAMITKSSTICRKFPYLSSTGASAVPPICAASALKFTPPRISPITGIRMSATSDETILPNAPPMITPTARSMHAAAVDEVPELRKHAHCALSLLIHP